METKFDNPDNRARNKDSLLSGSKNPSLEVDRDSNVRKNTRDAVLSGDTGGIPAQTKSTSSPVDKGTTGNTSRGGVNVAKITTANKSNVHSNEKVQLNKRKM